MGGSPHARWPTWLVLALHVACAAAFTTWCGARQRWCHPPAGAALQVDQSLARLTSRWPALLRAYEALRRCPTGSKPERGALRVQLARWEPTRPRATDELRQCLETAARPLAALEVAKRFRHALEPIEGAPEELRGHKTTAPYCRWVQAYDFALRRLGRRLEQPVAGPPIDCRLPLPRLPAVRLPDVLWQRSPRFRATGLAVRDGGIAGVLIYEKPWLPLGPHRLRDVAFHTSDGRRFLLLDETRATMRWAGNVAWRTLPAAPKGPMALWRYQVADCRLNCPPDHYDHRDKAVALLAAARWTKVATLAADEKVTHLLLHRGRPALLVRGPKATGSRLLELGAANTLRTRLRFPQPLSSRAPAWFDDGGNLNVIAFRPAGPGALSLEHHYLPAGATRLVTQRMAWPATRGFGAGRRACHVGSTYWRLTGGLAPAVHVAHRGEPWKRVHTFSTVFPGKYPEVVCTARGLVVLGQRDDKSIHRTRCHRDRGCGPATLFSAWRSPDPAELRRVPGAPPLWHGRRMAQRIVYRESPTGAVADVRFFRTRHPAVYPILPVWRLDGRWLVGGPR